MMSIPLVCFRCLLNLIYLHVIMYIHHGRRIYYGL
nr:MAG TPA: hypothetical protein [Caudoviricetes sp.]